MHFDYFLLDGDETILLYVIRRGHFRIGQESAVVEEYIVMLPARNNGRNAINETAVGLPGEPQDDVRVGWNAVTLISMLQLLEGVDGDIVPFYVLERHRIERLERQRDSAFEAGVLQNFLDAIRPIGGILCILSDVYKGVAGTS